MLFGRPLNIPNDTPSMCGSLRTMMQCLDCTGHCLLHVCTCLVLSSVCLLCIGIDCLSVKTIKFPFDDAQLDTNHDLYACTQQY